MFIGLCLLQPSFHKEQSPRQQETQELLVDVDWRFRLSLDITGFCRPAKLSWKMPKRPFTVCPRSFKDLDRIWPIDSSKIQRLALRSGWCEVWSTVRASGRAMMAPMMDSPPSIKYLGSCFGEDEIPGSIRLGIQQSPYFNQYIMCRRGYPLATCQMPWRKDTIFQKLG